MIGYFPTPYPDELLYSVCARHQDRAQYQNKLWVGLELFGEVKAGAAVDLPCHLNFLIENLPRGHRWTVERIIDEHTLFPYFRPFLSPQRVNRVNDSMQGSGSLIAKIAAGSAATSIRLANQLRYCPKCSDEDTKLQREPYWHRLHQVPGVEVCPVHHVFLEHSTARARNRSNIHDYVSAERAVCTAVSRQIDREDPAHQALLNVARDSAWLLKQRQIVPGLHELRRRYLRLLSDAGVASRSGWVWSKKIVRALEDYFSPGLLRSLQCGISKSSLTNWVSVLVKDLNRGKFHHPLRHLLLIQMLGHAAESFFSFPVEYNPFGDGPWPCLNPTCGNYRRPVITRCSLSTAISVASGEKRRVPVGTFACECGFIYRRSGANVSEDESYQVDRVEAYGPAWDETLRELWADSSLTLEDMALRLCGKHRSEQRIKIEAERLGLPFPRRYKSRRAANTYKKRSGARAKQDSATIKQSSGIMLREKQHQWLGILKKNPTALRTEIKEKFSSLYKWLDRQARKWLRKHLPPRKNHSFDWAGLDDSLAPAVAESAERIKSAEILRRVTLYAIGLDTDSYDHLRKHADKLPKTAKVLTQFLETRVEFTKRKIKTAALDMRERGLITTRAALIKEAKISRDMLRAPDVQALIESETSYPSEGHTTVLAA